MMVGGAAVIDRWLILKPALGHRQWEMELDLFLKLRLRMNMSCYVAGSSGQFSGEYAYLPAWSARPQHSGM